jgi:cob(I)alamin adenosyltransferase
MVSENSIDLSPAFLGGRGFFYAERVKGMNVVLKGRGTPKQLCGLADLVTDMVEVKHPYRQEIDCGKGIDY